MADTVVTDTISPVSLKAEMSIVSAVIGEGEVRIRYEFPPMVTVPLVAADTWGNICRVFAVT